MNMIGSIGSTGGRQQQDPVQQLMAEASQYSNNATIKSDLQALQEAQQAGRPQGPPPPPPGMGQMNDNVAMSPEAQMIGTHQGPPPPPPGMGQMQGMGQMGQMQGPPPPPPPQGQGQDQVATLIQKLAEDMQAAITKPCQYDRQPKL